MTIQHLHRVKYLCDYETDNCNPICLGIKGVTSDVLTRAILILQQAEYKQLIFLSVYQHLPPSPPPQPNLGLGFGTIVY